MNTFTGYEYLLIDIANKMGLDKISWQDRIKWTMNNKEILEKLSDDADEPILYSKAVRALRTVDKGEETNHIMALNCTASGLQIMAVLTGCSITARNVNLINTGKRKDIYTKVADIMLEEGLEYTRDELKPVTMCVFYGSKAKPKELFGEDTPELGLFYDIMHGELPGGMKAMGLMQRNIYL